MRAFVLGLQTEAGTLQGMSNLISGRNQIYVKHVKRSGQGKPLEAIMDMHYLLYVDRL